MAGAITVHLDKEASKRPKHATESGPVRWILITIALLFLGLIVLLPLVSIFVEALKKGIGVYVDSITDPDAMSALKLTLTTALIAVPINTVFGIAAAWAITKFRFRGKNIL
ncbi:sulfate/thiosulfate ABC transporter permease CysW, partial [Paenibacillus sp. MCAF20]